MHLCVTKPLALPSVCPNQKGAEQFGGNICNVKIIFQCPEVPSKELCVFSDRDLQAQATELSY